MPLLVSSAAYLFGSAQSRFVEVEIFVYEIGGKLRGGRMHEMPAKIFLPHLNRRARKNFIRAFEEIRLTDVQITGIRQIAFLEISIPLEVGREGLEGRCLHFVIILLRVAQLDLGA